MQLLQLVSGFVMLLARKTVQASRQSLATINHSDIPGLSCRLQENASAPPARTKRR